MEDFALGRADIDLNPTSFAVNASLGQRLTRTLTIANRGGTDLVWDASRYRYRDSTQPGGPAYAWVEIAETGRKVVDFGVPLPDVGLVFPFYGQFFDRVFVNPRGYLSFTDSDFGHSARKPLPHPDAPRNLLALCWAGQVTIPLPTTVYYQVIDPRTLVVEYKDVACSPPGLVSVQAILKTDGSILYQYKRVDESVRNHCTVGLQDGTGTRGLLYSHDNARVSPSSAVWLGHLPPWLRLDPSQGTVPAVSSQRVTLTFDSQYAGVGTHAWEFAIHSNDRDEGEVLVPVTFTVTEGVNRPPTVALTTPGDHAIFESPASIAFTATASDPDGTISRVEFYNGLTKVGEALQPPYAFMWDKVPTGTYTLCARAVDNAGLGWSSPPVTITVLTQRPACAIVSPQDGASVVAATDLDFKVLALDQDGHVERVELYAGQRKLGESATDSSGYAFFIWRQVPIGSHTFSALAIDNDGAVGASIPVTVTVNEPSATVPVFSLHPADVTKRPGQTAHFAA